MIKQRGIDALINECLIGPVLTMGATFVAFACALMAYCYLVSIPKAFPNCSCSLTEFRLFSGLHRPCLQPQWRVHASRPCVRLPYRPANHELLYDTTVKRHRYHLCGYGMGSGGPDEGASAAVPEHGQGVPSRTSGDTRLILAFF